MRRDVTVEADPRCAAAVLANPVAPREGPRVERGPRAAFQSRRGRPVAPASVYMGPAALAYATTPRYGLAGPHETVAVQGRRRRIWRQRRRWQGWGWRRWRRGTGAVRRQSAVQADPRAAAAVLADPVAPRERVRVEGSPRAACQSRRGDIVTPAPINMCPAALAYGATRVAAAQRHDQVTVQRRRRWRLRQRERGWCVWRRWRWR